MMINKVQSKTAFRGVKLQRYRAVPKQFSSDEAADFLRGLTSDVNIGKRFPIIDVAACKTPKIGENLDITLQEGTKLTDNKISYSHGNHGSEEMLEQITFGPAHRTDNVHTITVEKEDDLAYRDLFKMLTGAIKNKARELFNI